MRAVLLSTYELGHQPQALATPAALLAARGWHVRCFDLSREDPDFEALREADLAAFSLPMHTATRLAVPWIRGVRRINPRARLAAYGLYAQLNAEYLRSLGVHWIGRVPLGRTGYVVPLRDGLPPLEKYAPLRTIDGPKLVAAVEASHGCKHRCRHCPIVPVYDGQFRITSVEIVMADVRQQVAAGAQHVTFTDPDFFNGPTHARRVAEALHREFPLVTYDATIKVEHLLKHRDLLPMLRDTGCLFVTSAVESLDDAILERLDKGHTRSDFFECVDLMRAHGLTLAPTFLAFTPWTTRAGYEDLLRSLRSLDLIENVAPVQLALRLLVTAHSRLLELPDLRVGPLDPESLLHPWTHDDPEMDALAARLLKLVAKPGSRSEIFVRVWEEVFREPLDLMPRATVPYLDEPWYC
ncbi:MAG: radical SAM protein [Bryobacteraceae bacterium]|nr:radical SAM protein [Bryobacteraceae bacterium]